jgi:hypothetical protein
MRASTWIIRLDVKHAHDRLLNISIGFQRPILDSNERIISDKFQFCKSVFSASIESSYVEQALLRDEISFELFQGEREFLWICASNDRKLSAMIKSAIINKMQLLPVLYFSVEDLVHILHQGLVVRIYCFDHNVDAISQSLMDRQHRLQATICLWLCNSTVCARHFGWLEWNGGVLVSKKAVMAGEMSHQTEKLHATNSYIWQVTVHISSPIGQSGACTTSR